jgi:hypothetical protein
MVLWVICILVHLLRIQHSPAGVIFKGNDAVQNQAFSVLRIVAPPSLRRKTLPVRSISLISLHRHGSVIDCESPITRDTPSSVAKVLCGNLLSKV